MFAVALPDFDPGVCVALSSSISDVMLDSAVSISDPNVRRPLPNLLRLALGVRCSALGVRHLNAQRRGFKPNAQVALAVQPLRRGKKGDAWRT